MRAPIFFGKVDKGRISLDNKARFAPYLASFEGKKIELVLREKRDIRSGEQNAYYHAVVISMITEETGHTPEEVQEIVKDHFCVRSTTTLTKREFEDLMQRVRGWAKEFLNIDIPLPNEVDY